MGTQKPLIVPWLVEQLDAQRYPGVSWLNTERTLFRVPWKHGSRQSVSSEDFQIFEDWAIARGRYRPGIDQRTPSDWKRNFRAALNRKEGIKMIQDNSTDANDPHKMFEIQSDPILNGFAQGEANPVVSDVSALPLESSNVCGDSSSFSQDDTLESVLSALDLSGHTNEHSVLEHPVSCSDLPSSHMDLLLPAAPLSSLEQICESNTFESDFDVRVYYRGRQVLADVFKNVRGLCFLPPGCSSSHYPDLADVVLPDTDSLNDKQQAYYTNRILKGMGPGVLLRINGPWLCGMRQSSSHIYWSYSDTPTDETPHGELPKEQFGPVYYIQQFVQELIGYLEDRNGSPNYTLWFCFGEKWPDTDRPWKKKLIMVQVIPKTLETLHELSQAQGASSLKNCEHDLRISDSLSRLQDHLKEWEEKMEMQFN